MECRGTFTHGPWTRGHGAHSIRTSMVFPDWLLRLRSVTEILLLVCQCGPSIDRSTLLVDCLRSGKWQEMARAHTRIILESDMTKAKNLMPHSRMMPAHESRYATCAESHHRLRPPSAAFRVAEAAGQCHRHHFHALFQLRRQLVSFDQIHDAALKAGISLHILISVRRTIRRCVCRAIDLRNNCSW